ncbi:MAG TPA: hypothetical protein VGO46_18500 [Gemmatimonadaceae bacterium]|nr:hypothetical protein [Gemmatimonadaceae bacterium]
MIGSGDPTPYDFPLLVLFGIIALVFIGGAIAGAAWPETIATGLRRGGLLFAICALAAVLVISPTQNGIVGAGRVITIWPAFAIVVITFIAFSWRVGRL